MVRRSHMALFAVAKAPCIPEWAHNSGPDSHKLVETARAPGVERILAFTATATPAVVADICAAFDIPRECAIVTGFHRPNLDLQTTPVTSSERDQFLLDRLQTRMPGPTIVYVTLQRTAERVAELLAAAGLPARPRH